MSRKTRKLKARIEELRNDVKYHLSNVRILLNNPSLLQVEELKFQYGFFPVRETISGSIRKIERIKDEVKNDNVVAKGVSFGTFSGEEYKFPKEEMESREYHVSKHAPVNMLDNKNTISLPEHWYIRVTHDNVGLLNDYLKTHKHRYKQYQDTWYVDDQWIDGDNCAFFHSDSKDAAHTIPTPMDEYTEVTTEMVKNYMKTWHNINSLVDKSWLVEKDVKLGENYIGDVKFQKSDLLDKSWLEVKKEAERMAIEQLSKQTDVNKDGEVTNVNLLDEEDYIKYKEKKKLEREIDKITYTPLKDKSDEWADRLESQKEYNKLHDELLTRKDLTKEQMDNYDAFFKMHVDHTIEAGTYKAPEKWIKVIVKEGSIIITPDVKGITMVKAMPTQDPIRVGDLGKCTDQECKPPKED